MATAASQAVTKDASPLSNNNMVNGEEAADEDESLRDMMLRYRFQDHQFAWRAFSAAGWKWNAAKGYSNGQQVLASAKELCAFMDRFALPNVYSNLQQPEIQQQQFGNGDDEKGKRMRRDVITKLHELTMDDENDDNEDPSQSRTERKRNVESQTEATTTARPRRSTRTKPPEEQTVTRAEKGSDLYLHRKTRGGRTIRSKKQTAGVPPSDNASPTDIILPTLEECVEFVKDLSAQDANDGGSNDKESIETSYEQYFGDWRFLLSTNHSLLLFGTGSKFNLMQNFCDKELNKEGYAIVINGFDKAVSVDGILDLLVQLFLDGKEPGSSSTNNVNVQQDTPVVGISRPLRAHPLVERAIDISRALARQAEESLVPIFLAIHNLEGESLRRNAADQQALAALVANSTVTNGVRSVRLVASIDHTDTAANLWDLPTSTNFSWIWKEVNTFRPYQEEFVMLVGEDVKKKGPKTKTRNEEQQVARVMDVLKNIAPRHAEVVQVLATLQLEQLSQKGRKWVDFATFRDKCRNRYVVNKDSQLPPLLTELKDHRLITSMTEKSSEYLCVPYSNEKLREILEYSRKGN